MRIEKKGNSIYLIVRGSISAFAKARLFDITGIYPEMPETTGDIGFEIKKSSDIRSILVDLEYDPVANAESLEERFRRIKHNLKD